MIPSDTQETGPKPNLNSSKDFSIFAQTIKSSHQAFTNIVCTLHCTKRKQSVATYASPTRIITPFLSNHRFMQRSTFFMFTEKPFSFITTQIVLKENIRSKIAKLVNGRENFILFKYWSECISMVFLLLTIFV